MSGPTSLEPGWSARRSGLVVPASVRRAPAVTAAAMPRSPERRGRPSYASGYGQAVLRSAFSARLLGQFYGSIPALRRAVSILANFAGVPTFDVGSETENAELNTWAQEVPVGYIGQGLQTWVVDHLSQALIFGYAVGEAEIGADRAQVPRLWSYSSPQFYFRSEEDGALSIIQPTRAGAANEPLSDVTTVSTTYDPLGCDPRGQSLFLSIPTVAQIWMDMLHAVRQTARRIGIETHHVNWEPPSEFQDTDGSISDGILDKTKEAWNAAIKSQAIDGIAADFFSVGKWTISPIGGLSELVGIQENKRAILEEVTVATGIPPWLLGYTWSTTERLSQQQADMLITNVEALRRCVGGALAKLAALHRTLLGKPGPVALVWAPVNLQDAVERARAALVEAQANVAKEKFARSLWEAGVWDQEQYAENLTGSPDVATPMDEPPAARPAGNAPEEGSPSGQSASAAAAAELRAEWEGYRKAGLFAAAHAGCRHGKGSADDPVQLFPTEKPQYPSLAREVSRAWGVVTELYLSLREGMFGAVGLDDPAKAAKARKSEPLTPAQIAAVDQAIETFLRQFAGADRTPDGFASGDTEDGALQQLEILAYQTGVQRAVALVEAEGPVLVSLSDLQRRRLLSMAFARLSAGSRLRFADRLGEIKQELLDGFERGENPLAIARRLDTNLSAYWAARLRTICRTEAAFASEAGILDEGEAQGVTLWDILGDPTTDDLCVSAQQGGPYTTEALRGRLPIHPNCFCSSSPKSESA